MKKYTILLLALGFCLNGFGFSNPAFIGSLPEAKYKAATEGKLYMVKFTAGWCMPCKWMDKNTFTDARVQKYISSNYVPVSIDVDDFDGMVIKQQYEVQVLPTIIIFNSQGEEVSRYAESLGPSRLLSILEQHNIPANSIKTYAEKPIPEPDYEDLIVEDDTPLIISRPHLPKVNTTETEVQPTEPAMNTEVIREEPVIVEPTREEPVVTEVIIEEPVITEVIIEEPVISEVIIEQPKSNTDVVTNSYEVGSSSNYPSPTNSNSATTVRSSEELAFLSGEGIFEIDVQFQEKTGFSIQIGVYEEYNNVLSEVNKFKNQFGERVFVHIDKLNGATVYRLLLGHFQEAQFAETKKIGLEAAGIICYVRNLKNM